MIDKPLIDRARTLREEAAEREVARLLQDLLGELAPGESLGLPVRTEDHIVIPIEGAESDADKDAEDDAVRALVSAWLDDETGSPS